MRSSPKKFSFNKICVESGVRVDFYFLVGKMAVVHLKYWREVIPGARSIKG